MIALRFLERLVREGIVRWRLLSLDAKVVGGLATLNWVLLLQSHTVVMVDRDQPIWQLFPGVLGPVYLIVLGLAAVAYPLRDLRAGTDFGARDRWRHLVALVFLFIVLPTVAAIVLRATGKPYTYIHDGALMAEEAARKFLSGQNPYAVDYLDTPLFYWPMVNNPALYHFTYFPLLFLFTIPGMLATAPLHWFDERLLFLPATLACFAVAALLVRGTATRIAIVAAIALNPQVMPFVIEGRNDAPVLLCVLLTVYFLQRERPAAAGLSLAIATGLKLHAMVLAPFVFAYLVARARPRDLRDALRAARPALVPFAIVSALVFVPFVAWDPAAFFDDVVAYNAGASAWSYPISGAGFSMLLHALGVIPYRTADFPFWLFEVTAAVPMAIWWLTRLWRRPTLATMLAGYGMTLLAFLFFGRYFQTSYLGYVVAALTPALFFWSAAPRRVVEVVVHTPAMAPIPVTTGSPGD